MIVADEWRPLREPVELGYLRPQETLVRFHGRGEGRSLQEYGYVTDEERFPFVAGMVAEGMLVEVRRAPEEKPRDDENSVADACQVRE